MFELASRREFDLVLFWALHRFSREGVLPTLHYRQRLDSYDVACRYFTEQHLDSKTGLTRRDLDHGDHRQAGEHTPIRARHGRAGESQAPRREVREAASLGFQRQSYYTVETSTTCIRLLWK